MNNNIIIANDFERKEKSIAHSIGIVSGAFCPLHKGHLALIEKSQEENDITVIVCAGYPGDRGGYELPLKERYKRLRRQFENESKTYIALLDERIPKAFDDIQGVLDYRDSVEQILSIYCLNYLQDKKEITIRNYVGDPKYKPVLDKAYPDWSNVLINRYSEEYSLKDFCATRIRENPFKYWEDIADAFKGVYRKVVLFSGACSVGKSTLSEYFAKKYNGILIPEVARDYMERNFVLEEDLNERDYLAFIENQLGALEKAKIDCSNAKVAFVDTDGFSTAAYLELNLEKVDMAYLSSLKLITEISKKWTMKNVDCIMLLPNDVEFEFDGSRDGHLEDTRPKFYNLLKQDFYKHYLVPCTIHEGSLQEKIQECDKIIQSCLS